MPFLDVRAMVHCSPARPAASMSSRSVRSQARSLICVMTSDRPATRIHMHVPAAAWT